MVKPKVITNGWVHVVLLAVALIPTGLGYSVYLTDLPNGILRTTLNLKLLADPAASDFYTFAPVLIPNLTLDSWGLVVGPWLGPERAVSVLVGLSVILLYTAVQALRAAIVGRTSLLVGAIALLLIQSGNFRWGLVNYEIGVGLALWTIAISEYQARRDGLLTATPLALRSALALLAVMSSIFPVLILGCYTAGRLLTTLRKGREAWSWPAATGLCLPMVLPAVFVLLARKKPPGSDLDTIWTIYGKVSGWISLFFVRGPGLELPLAFAFGAALLVAIATLRARIDRRLYAFLWLMLLVYVLVPSRLFGVDAVDYRLAQPMALVALGSVSLTISDNAAWERWGRVVTVAFMILAASKSFITMQSLAPIRDLRSELTRTLDAVPSRATLLFATTLPEFRFQGHRIWHLPLLSLADLGRDIYAPSLFMNFFLHEKRPDDIMPDWVEETELRSLPIVCAATHVLLIGDTSRAADIAAMLPAVIVSSSPDAVVFATDRPACVSRRGPPPSVVEWMLRSSP